MEDKPILTIGIPAYNRSNNLGNLLDQLSNEDVSKFVLIISDDASPEDPSKVINRFKNKIPNLVYIRNKSNLGFSGNVCQIYDAVETPFIWFICDDDHIYPGCISQIVYKLNKYDPTVTILNHTWVNPYGIEKIAGVNEDKIYAKETGLGDYNVLMRTTFLSTLILKKIKDSSEIRKTDYTNNVFIQITLALMLLSEKLKIAELSTLAIKRHVGYNYGEFFKFYIVDHLRAIFAYKHRFNNSKFVWWSTKGIPTAFKLYLSQKMGLFKYRGIPTLRTIKEVFRFYGIFSIVIFAFVPIYFLIPSALLKFIYRLQLRSYHSRQKAEEVYYENIDRAEKDSRKTKFTEYR